ncbi:hypothetical protein, partial [Burkholderia ubonensis]|uniref:hypothetical protein n=1 Tax=Burkholderia ubonensis TaxID=101571 RepID=UPI001C432004
ARAFATRYVGFARLRGASDFRRALYGTERSRGIDQLPFLLDLTRPRNHPSEQSPSHHEDHILSLVLIL